jgi:hypothetical protein
VNESARLAASDREHADKGLLNLVPVQALGTVGDGAMIVFVQAAASFAERVH